jgi:hypothetical protein
MADLTTTPVATQIQPPKGMTLADMVNLAGGVQAYQQAQQINPLQLQKAQMEIEQLQKTNPLVARKAAAEAATAEIGTQREQFALDKSHLDVTGGALTGLESRAKVHKQRNDKNQALKELDATEKMLNAYGLPSKENGPFAQAKEQIKKGDWNGYIGILENMKGIQASASEKFQASLPQPVTNAAGQIVGYTRETNTVQPPNVPTQDVVPSQPSIPKISQENQSIVVPKRNPFSTQQQFATPANPTSVQAGIMKGQAENAQNLYTDAIQSLSNPGAPSYLPNQEFVAQKLLSYLKDPNVKTGPIADALAGKTNQATLTPKEQEILKLIQQRIQNLNPRTDADAQSKKDAYGSFRMDKEALSDIIRQDIGWIRTDMLRKQGIRNYGGNASNPNLEAATNFNSEFSNFAQNPILSQYIGIVGTGKTAHIDEHDEKALAKLFKENNLGKVGINALEQARKNLVEMSTGGK